MLNYLESDMQSCQWLGEFHFPKECPNLPVMLWLSCIVMLWLSCQAERTEGSVELSEKGLDPAISCCGIPARFTFYAFCLRTLHLCSYFPFLFSWFKFLFAFWIVFKVFLLHAIWSLKGQDKTGDLIIQG